MGDLLGATFRKSQLSYLIHFEVPNKNGTRPTFACLDHSCTRYKPTSWHVLVNIITRSISHNKQLLIGDKTNHVIFSCASPPGEPQPRAVHPQETVAPQETAGELEKATVGMCWLSLTKMDRKNLQRILQASKLNIKIVP